MGLTVKNKNNLELGEDISSFFSLPVDEENKDTYDDIKNEIYNLDIDVEKKAYIINRINLLSTNISIREKNNIRKEIENFQKEYNLY